MALSRRTLGYIGISRGTAAASRRFLSSQNDSFKTEKFDSTAADMIYRNPESISNRLQLFHLLRLKTQEHLDRKSLNEMSLKYPDEKSPTFPVRITSRFSLGEPGCERQFDPVSATITVNVPIESLKLDEREYKNLKALLPKSRVKVTSKFFTFSVSNFPFSSQNQARALKILHDLVTNCKTLDLNLTTQPTEDSLDIVSPTFPKRRRPRVSLRFPSEWLKDFRIKRDKKVSDKE